MRQTPPDKLSPPPLAISAAGQRLRARIDDAASLVWVHAAPGFGMRSAVRAWAATKERLVRWYRVDSQDQDALYSACSLRRLFAGERDPGREGFRERASQNLSEAWELLLDELDSRLTDPLWIVLEGVEQICNLESHPVWSTLLLRQSTKLRLLVTSHRALPDKWSRWTLNRHILPLGPEELRWSLEEARAWIEHWGLSGEPLAVLEIERMLAASEGWGAGFEYLVHRHAGRRSEAATEAMRSLWSQMQLSVRSRAPQRSSWSSLLAIAPSRSVSDELLRKLDPSCELLGLLSSLVSDKLMVRLEATGRARRFVFHPLFAELLQEGGEVLAPEPEQCSRLAKTFVEAGRPLDALLVLAKSERWGLFLELLDRCASSLCDHPNLSSLSWALRGIPAERIGEERRVWLMVFRGLSYQGVDDLAALDQLRAALQERHRLDLEWQAVAVCAMVQMTLNDGRDFSSIPDYIDQMESLLASSTKEHFSRSRQLELYLSAMMCMLLVRPNHPKHAPWRDAILAFPAQVFATPKHAALAATLIQKYALTGWVHYAQQIFNRLKWSEGRGVAGQTRLAIEVGHFFIDVISGLFVELLERASDLERSLERQGASLWRSETQAMTAFAALCVGDRSRLETSIAQLNTSQARRSPFYGLCAPLLISLKGALVGDYDRIFEGQRKSIEVADRLGFCHYQCTTRSCLAMNLFEHEAFEMGQVLLSQAQKMAQEFAMPVSTWCVELVRAFRYLQLGEKSSCAKIVKEVFAQMREAGCYTLPLHFHRGYSDLLTFALQSDIEVSFVVNLIRRTRKYHLYIDISIWPAKYELNVLGGFSLTVDGQDCTTKFRQTANRFELLTALIWLGGRGVKEELLLDSVWSHVRTDPRGRLRQAIRRLCQSLGRSDAIVWEEGVVSFHPNLWRLDTWRVQERLMQLRELASDPNQDALSLRKELVALRRLVERGFVGATPVPTALLHAQDIPTSPSQVGPPELLEILQQVELCLSGSPSIGVSAALSGAPGGVELEGRI